MSDLIRREDAYAAIRGLTRHMDRIAAISALPAVQPDVIQDAIGELRDLVRCRCHPGFKDRGLHDPDCHCDSAEAVEVLVSALPAAQPHVNEMPKREHETRDMLTPATKGGDA